MANNNYNSFFEDDEKHHIPQEKSQNTTSIQKRKHNRPIIILLSCILLVGIAILGIHIFQPFEKYQNANNADYQQSDNYMDGSGSGDEEQFHQEGSAESGGENQLVGEMDLNGHKILFKITDGKAKYSTDSGKTWSEEPPEGMPPLP